MAKLQLKSGGSGLESLSIIGKTLVGLLFVAIFAAAYFIVFYSDVESALASQGRAKEAKAKELSKARDAKQAYNKDLAEKARREQLLQKQKKILPETAETGAFLQTLQNVATISGAKLTNWEPGDEATADFYAKIPMELQLEGKFHQVAKFFHGVSQADRIIDIENVQMEVIESKEKNKNAEQQLAGDEVQVSVKVKCLATAFRALRLEEAAQKEDDKKGSKKKKKKRKKK